MKKKLNKDAKFGELDKEADKMGLFIVDSTWGSYSLFKDFYLFGFKIKRLEQEIFYCNTLEQMEYFLKGYKIGKHHGNRI